MRTHESIVFRLVRSCRARASFLITWGFRYSNPGSVGTAILRSRLQTASITNTALPLLGRGGALSDEAVARRVAIVKQHILGRCFES